VLSQKILELYGQLLQSVMRLRSNPLTLHDLSMAVVVSLALQGNIRRRDNVTPPTRCIVDPFLSRLFLASFGVFM
jgi:hypothetical protein